MPSDRVVNAIQLIHAGKISEAQQLLKQEIKVHPEDELAWIWYIETLPSLTARIKILEEFLRRFPENSKARQVLHTLQRKREEEIRSGAMTTLNEPTDQSAEPDKAPSSHTSAKARANTKPAKNLRMKTPTTESKKKGPGKLVSVAISLAIIVLLYLGWQALFPGDTEKDPDPTEYVAAITPILNDIKLWNEGPIMIWGIRMQSKDSWGISTYEEDLQDPTLRVIRRDELIQVLIPIAESIATDGEKIITSLQDLTPPDELLTDHQTIQVCIQFQIDKAHATADFIRHDSMQRLTSGACSDFAMAFTRIETYIANLDD